MIFMNSSKKAIGETQAVWVATEKAKDRQEDCNEAHHDAAAEARAIRGFANSGLHERRVDLMGWQPEGIDGPDPRQPKILARQACRHQESGGNPTQKIGHR
jgi:hypothetical protein